MRSSKQLTSEKRKKMESQGCSLSTRSRRLQSIYNKRRANSTWRRSTFDNEEMVAGKPYRCPRPSERSNTSVLGWKVYVIIFDHVHDVLVRLFRLQRDLSSSARRVAPLGFYVMNYLFLMIIYLSIRRVTYRD